MKGKISPNECNSMFLDRFNSLNMRDLGLELKHFEIGTAPERPSYLANQEELKNCLIEKFKIFFDPKYSQGLEIIFLKSNYGNGKSHFIQTIKTFFNDYENVLTKKVSLKQEKTDLKIKLLEGIGQKMIKDCATFFVKTVSEEISKDTKEIILSKLVEDYQINIKLSELLFYAANDEDISKQAQAVAILKGNYLNDYLKTFKLNRTDLNSDFYFSVIKLVCDYLFRHQYYYVIVFDEYEHINSWKSVDRKLLFEDIKYFTDNIDTFKNIFFIFAESEAMNNDTVVSEDPAFFSRMKGKVYEIKSISSKKEVENLFKMIKIRYEKYYDISLDDHIEDILNTINNTPNLKTNSNYRAYSKVIMHSLDKYKNLCNQDEKFQGLAEGTNDFKSKWIGATTISKKTLLCEAFEFILKQSTEEIIFKNKKKGVYQSQKNTDIIEYHIVVTENPSRADFIKRYKEAMKVLEENNITKCILLYPYKKNICDNKDEYKNVIFFDMDNIPDKLNDIYSLSDQIEEVFVYLQSLKARY